MAPDTIGRYQIKSLLGKGGMGSVYKAWDPTLHRMVALKVVNLDQIESERGRDEFKRRFFKEARICGGLNHPGILTIHDIGEEDGTPFIATEYIDGMTLSLYLDKTESLDGKILGDVILQVGAALDYAHQNGIVHRDIKPQNIMINGKNKITILDFGLAKLTEAEMTHLTRPGDFVGSPSYSSPEQVKGAIVDHRTDIFSFAVTCYELITGYRPFMGGNINAILFKIISGVPDPIILPKGFPENIQSVLTDVFNKALHKIPDCRFQSAGELAEVLNAILSEGDLSWNIHADAAAMSALMAERETLLLSEEEQAQKKIDTNMATRWFKDGSKSGKSTAPHSVAGEPSILGRSTHSPALVIIASILFIVAAGVVWLQMQDRKPDPPSDQPATTTTTQNPPPEQPVDQPETLEPEATDTPDTAAENDANPSNDALSENRPGPLARENDARVRDTPETNAPRTLILLSFPDPAFQDWLVSEFDRDGNGALDQSEIAGVATLDTPGNDQRSSNIRDLTGIGYFTSLQSLTCAHENLSQLPPLPAGLRQLDCSGNNLRTLSGLPDSLVSLNARDNKINSVDALPDALKTLDLADNLLETVPPLPANLQNLRFAGNRLQKAPELNKSLKSADLTRNLFDGDDCEQLAAAGAGIADFRYSPIAGGDDLDCARLAELRKQNRAKITGLVQQFNAATDTGDLESARAGLKELEAAGAARNDHFFVLQKLETEDLMNNWRPNMPMDAGRVQRFQKTAAMGSAEAQFSVGFLFEKGIGDRPNHFEAKKWYEKAAAQNFMPAVYGLGVIYEAGEAVPRDDERAAEFFIRAADANYTPAQHKLGEMYRTGNGMDLSYEKAVKYYRLAAENNYAPAQSSLGYMYYENLGVGGNKRENKKIAAYWYCRSAVQGNGAGKMGLKKLKKSESDCEQILSEKPE